MIQVHRYLQHRNHRGGHAYAKANAAHEPSCLLIKQDHVGSFQDCTDASGSAGFSTTLTLEPAQNTL
jgi:hypothetical protein